MNYWINIHHPPEEGEGVHNVYFQEKNGRRYLREFEEGDLAFIYETEGPPGVEVQDEKGKRTLQLRVGRKGIVALVEVLDDFVPRRSMWDGRPFVGYFNTQPVKCRKNFVPLNAIRRTWLRTGLGGFSPRINGGMRKLSYEEYITLAKLIGAPSTARRKRAQFLVTVDIQ